MCHGLHRSGNLPWYDENIKMRGHSFRMDIEHDVESLHIIVMTEQMRIEIRTRWLLKV